MLSGLAALVGLHLIVEDHNLRPFSIPLLVMCMIQLGLNVYRYVFVGGKSSALFTGRSLLLVRDGLVFDPDAGTCGIARPAAGRALRIISTGIASRFGLRLACPVSNRKSSEAEKLCFGSF